MDFKARSFLIAQAVTRYLTKHIHNSSSTNALIPWYPPPIENKNNARIQLRFPAELNEFRTKYRDWMLMEGPDGADAYQVHHIPKT